MQTSLGDRIKSNYEDRYRFKLTRRTPVIMRLDGKAFHTLTRKAAKPFDNTLREAMAITAAAVLREVQGAKCAYVQSDEINILITDFDTLQTDAWFDYNVQKMVSVSAAIASVEFTKQYQQTGYFDSRVFNVPKEEVLNYFRWRYQDWLRNSIQMLAQSLYSHKDLHQKHMGDLHEMCFQKGHNWADLPACWRNGTLLHRTPTAMLVHHDFNLMSRDDIDSGLISSYLTQVEE